MYIQSLRVPYWGPSTAPISSPGPTLGSSVDSSIWDGLVFLTRGLSLNLLLDHPLGLFQSHRWSLLYDTLTFLSQGLLLGLPWIYLSCMS